MPQPELHMPDPGPVLVARSPQALTSGAETPASEPVRQPREDVPRAIERLRGHGSALPPGVGERMGSALGEDLTPVRIHTGPDADHLSRRVGARAFTVGHDIFFASGAYHPGSLSGRQLLAHELTHVAQQAGSARTDLTAVSDPGDRSERQARSVAARVAAGTPVAVPPLHHTDRNLIQRENGGGEPASGTTWTEERTSTRSVMIGTEYTSHALVRFDSTCDNPGIEIANTWLTGVTSMFPNSAEVNVFFGGPPPGWPRPGRKVEEDEGGGKTIQVDKYLHTQHFIKLGVEIKGFGYAATVSNGTSIQPLRVTATCGSAEGEPERD